MISRAALGLPNDPVKATEAILVANPRFVDLVKVRTAEGERACMPGKVALELERGGQYAMRTALTAVSRSIALSCVGATRAGGVRAPQSPYRLSGEHSHLVGSEGIAGSRVESPNLWSRLRLAPGQLLMTGRSTLSWSKRSAHSEYVASTRLMGSGELRTSRLKRWRSQRVRLTADRPCMFHGDGEIIGTTPVEIEVVPRAVQVLAPALR